MAKSDDIKIVITADSKNAEKVLKKLSSAMDDVGDSAKKSNQPLNDFGNKIGELASKAKFAGVVVAAAKTTAALMEFSASCIKAGMQTAKLKSSLEVLTGSVEKGQRTYKEFAEFAAETPFDTVGVVNYGKQMIAMGYDVNEVTKYLRVFGDTASATGSDLGSIVLVMGQIRNATSLQLQDINQLQNAGVNVWQMLAKEAGKSVQEMKEAVHNGAISGAQAFEMLSKQMQATFGGMMDKQADSLEGAINELGETVDNTKARFGEWLATALNLKEGIKALTMGLKDLTGNTEETRKADTKLANIQAQVQQAIDDTQYVVETLEDQMHRGIITSQEYREKEAAIREGCEIAQNGIANVNSAVDTLNGMMAQGIITAGDYARALASIASAQARMGAVGQQMQQAILNGDQDSVDNLKIEMASIAAEVAYDVSEAKAIGQHYSTYGKDGSGAIKSSSGLTLDSKTASSSGGSLSSAKAKEEDPFQLMMKKHEMEMEFIKSELDYKLAAGAIEQEYYDQQMEARRVSNNTWVEEQLKSEGLLTDQKIALWKEYMAKTKEVVKEQSKQVNAFWDGMAKNFASAMTDCIMGAKSFGEAFKGIIKQIIAQLMQAAIYAAIVSAFSGGATSFGSAFKGALDIPGKKADGGYVSGPGTGTSDSIPTMLSNGEFVLTADTTRRLGVPFLNGLNSGRLPAFASGGLVGSAGVHAQSSGTVTGSGGNNVVLNISAMDASGFGDFLARGGLDSIKQAMFDDGLNFAAEAGVF